MNSSRCSALSLRSLVLLTSLFALSATSFAQLSSATLNGVVRDPTGAVIAKASVVLSNVDTGIDRPGSSNETGNYVFVDITPGRYTLKVTAEGFSTKKVSAFVLAVNQTATIDVLLPPGAQTEVVTVDASTEQLQTSTAELGTVIATHQVNDLPLNGRNFTQLLSLTPGVSPISVGQNSMGGRTGGFAAPIAEGAEFTFPSVNGATNRSNYFLTDGMSNFAAFLSTYAVPPIIDSIQEFKVVSRTDTAEFGSVLGGVVNVVTKSGSAQFHGAGWEYIRNDAFDARPTNPNFLAPTAKKPSFRQNQFGASIGGPVALPGLKNNTFFYFAYQGFRYSQPSSSNILVPTAGQLTGDFSGICGSGFTAGVCNDRVTDSKGVVHVNNQLYDPFSTVAVPTTVSPSGFSRTPFANNIVPAGMIDPRIVGFIQAVYPAAGPYNALTNSNAIDTDLNTQHQNEFNVRLDHNFGQRDSVWFRYSFINSNVTVPAGLPGLIKNEAIPGRDWGGSYVHTFSPTLQLQGLFSRTTVSDDSTTRFAKLDAQTIDQAAGFSPDFVSNFAGAKGWLIPAIGPGNGIASAGEGVQNTPQATDNYQYSVTLTKVKGSHAFKFGGNYITSRFSSPISSVSEGFATTQTNDTNGFGGFGLASALLGVVDNANRRNVNETTRKGGLVSAFFQDSWKASTNLTINYGLRYDLTLIPPYGTLNTIGLNGGIETGEPNYTDGTYVLQFPPPPCTVRGFAPCIPSISLDANGNAVACDPKSTTQTCLPPGTLPPHVVVDPRGRISHNTYTNLGPHLGFAYRVGEKTVVRGSAGVVYDNWAAVSQMSQNIEGDWPGIGQLIATSVNAPGTQSAPAGTPTVVAQNPFAGNGTAGLPGATPFSPSNVNWYYDPHIKNAYAYQYNFGIQRQLNSSTTVTASYVGSSTRRANIGGMYNTALKPSATGDPQARALFPYMIASFYDRSNGFADYNAFQFQLDKRFTNGLAYQVAYTFSKALTENDGWFGSEGKNVADPYNPRASLSPAGYNLPHILTANVVYELPLGAGKRFSTGSHAVDYIVGNWQVNSIFTIRSGQPYGVTDGEDQANTGNTGWAGYEQANLVGDPNSGSCPNGARVKTRTCLFNTSAFAKPTRGTFGNVRPDGFQQPKYWNVDASVFRQFPLWSDNRRLEFRAEAFNLLNNVVLGGPGSTGNGGDINNPGAFGIVTGAANSSRELQFGLKFIF